jgi:uncharacterized protein with GYD domain
MTLTAHAACEGVDFVVRDLTRGAKQDAMLNELKELKREQYDGVIICELPRMAEAMQASVLLKRSTDISFFTAAAMPIEEFDQLLGEI